MYSFIEWVWTFIAGIGILASGWLYLQAREDVLFLLKNAYNGRRLIVARGHERREFIRAVIQGLGLYVGIYALSLPNPPGAQLNVATLCLVGMQALVVTNTVFDARDRNRLAAYWKNVDLRHVKERDEEVKGDI